MRQPAGKQQRRQPDEKHHKSKDRAACEHYRQGRQKKSKQVVHALDIGANELK